MFIEVSPRITHVPLTTTLTTTTTKIEDIPIISSTEPIKITNKLFEHTNEMIISTESTPIIKESNQTISREDDSSSTFASSTYFDETTLGEQRNSEESYTTINQPNNEELSTTSMPANQTRLFHLLASLTPEPTKIQIRNYTISENTTTTTTTTSEH